MTVSPYKLASVLLQYPTVALFDGLGRCSRPRRRASRGRARSRWTSSSAG